MATDGAAEAEGRFRVGLDIGGTFTDLAVYDKDVGAISQFKSSTTVDPVECVSHCLEKAAQSIGLEVEAYLPQVELVFCFGSTIGLNTLLTRTGATVGVITTKGHRDAYHTAEMDRGGVVDIRQALEQTFQPMIPRRRILEVTERLDYTGKIVIPIDEEAVREAARHLVDDLGVDALVISFLWAQRNGVHEQRAKEVVEELYPDLFVTGGAEISGTFGEFGRVATAIINAYIGKAVQDQGERLRDWLQERGLRVPLLVMQTLGGVAPLSEVVRRPVVLLNSGPAGGAVGALTVARQLEERNVVCIDMGGTSADISAITDGEIELSGGLTVLGHPVSVSGVEIASIGAGGGSIATLERAGSVARLRVGPESAGARPGPACYGRGGTLATVTDANLTLGLLDPSVLLGGELQLDLAKAHTAITEHASESGSPDDVVADAWGVFRVITSQMADAIENFLVSKGLDPRRYRLAAFGAAGGAHAAAIGARLGSPTVTIPNFFPVFSAFGLMSTDIRHAYSLTDDAVKLTVGRTATIGADQAEYMTDRLRDVAQLPMQLLAEENVPPDKRQMNLFVDMRYSGQILELSAGVSNDALEQGLDADAVGVLLRGWLDKYKRVYGEGAAWSEGQIEVINYRAVGVGTIESPRMPTLANGASATAPAGQREIFLGEPMAADVWKESSLRRGMTITGPAIVEDELRTVVIGPGDVAEVDDHGHLHITPGNGWAW